MIALTIYFRPVHQAGPRAVHQCPPATGLIETQVHEYDVEKSMCFLSYTARTAQKTKRRCACRGRNSRPATKRRSPIGRSPRDSSAQRTPPIRPSGDLQPSIRLISASAIGCWSPGPPYGQAALRSLFLWGIHSIDHLFLISLFFCSASRR